VYFNPALPKIYLQIGLSACFLIGPALYYFVQATLKQVTDFPRRWKFQIAALVGIIPVMGILFYSGVYPQEWNRYLIYIIYAQWFLYMIATGIALRQQWTKFFNRTSALPAGFTDSEKWLLAIYACNVPIFLSFQLSLILAPQGQLYFSGAVIFSCLLYLGIFVLLYQRKTKDLFSPAAPRYTAKKISDNEAATWLNTLHQLMVEKEMYKNPNLNLGDLAKAINLPSHQLSQVLNDNLGKNFTSFINEYRINAACKMIAADHPFSLEAIGYEVGFNSKSTFYTSFKKINSTTPLLYKESLKKARIS
jgi:AraC-like DNA-binding protein